MEKRELDLFIDKFKKIKKNLPKKYKYQLTIDREKNKYLSLTIHLKTKEVVIYSLDFTIDEITNKHRITESPVYYEMVNGNKHYRVGDGWEHKFKLSVSKKYFEKFMDLIVITSHSNLKGKYIKETLSDDKAISVLTNWKKKFK